MLLKLWLYFNALVLAWISFFAFLAPQKVASAVGFELPSAAAIVEIKATYGGLMLALAAFLVWCDIKDYKAHALVFLALMYIGFAGGRLIGILSNKAWNQTLFWYLLFEIIALLITILIYLSTQK